MIVVARKVAVVGVGQSKFGRRTECHVTELAFESFKEALEDCGLEQKDIEFASVGSAGAGAMYEEALVAPLLCEYLGLNPAGAVRCEAACATGMAAVHMAHHMVASGHVDVAMALGVEKMSEVDTPTMVEFIGRSGSYLWEFENFGLTFPGYYAIHATRHMWKFGTTEEHLAMIAVKNHKYGAMNPKAQFQRETTVDEVLRSPVIAWPLKLFDCCPITDGSATVILASEEKAGEITDTPVWVKGLGEATVPTNLARRSDYVGIESAVVASRKAYKMAGVGPEDIDVATAHDCFTIAELMAYEDLGFCEKGEGKKFVEEGQMYVGGKHPVNVDGGLKAKGHPIGATGCAMIYELTKQLRGEVKPSERQAPIKRGVALAHNVGGTGHYCYVTILGR